jgi:hypothetical protein
MLTRHITYTALRETSACNCLNDNENCAADCDNIRALLWRYMCLLERQTQDAIH